MARICSDFPDWGLTPNSNLSKPLSMTELFALTTSKNSSCKTCAILGVIENNLRNLTRLTGLNHIMK